MSQDCIEVLAAFLQDDHQVKSVYRKPDIRVKHRVVAWTSSRKTFFARSQTETKKKMKKLIAVSLAMSFGAIVAQASIITETTTVNPTGSSGTTGFTFSLPTFDSNLGTLNSVELTLTPILGDFGSSAYNFSPTSQSISGATVGNWSGSLGNSLLGLNATYSSAAILTSPDYIAAAGPNVMTDGPALPFVWTTTSSSAGLTADDYAALSGMLSVNGSAIGTYAGSDGVWFVGGYGNVGGSLEVAFNYTPVPETSTVVAGMLLLLPFGMSTLRILRKTRTA
jgi:hypothetical protein